MGTLVNGIKEIFATSQTTATHLPVCASDGTPQGRISVGDLASVLGGFQNFGSWANKDLNDIKKTGVTYAYNTTTNRPPESSAFSQTVYILSNNLSSGTCIQIAHEFNDANKLWVRSFNANWTNWYRIDTNIPTFYKNYSTLAALATGIRGEAGNYALISSGSGATDLLTNCKAYYETMDNDTIAFVHIESTTTSFGYIIKGRMGSGVGLIKVMKGASGEVACYKKLYNSSEWVESTF